MSARLISCIVLSTFAFAAAAAAPCEDSSAIRQPGCSISEGRAVLVARNDVRTDPVVSAGEPYDLGRGAAMTVADRQTVALPVGTSPAVPAEGPVANITLLLLGGLGAVAFMSARRSR